MSDRTVRVRYEAEVNSFIANVQKMQATQDGFTKSAQSTAQSHTAAMNQIGQGMVVAGGIVGAFAVGAVAKFADFDQAMSHTQAATGATGDSLSGLRDLAIKMGADTQFSATEAAQGITEMAKAGVSTADIMGGGLKGALDLAAAGQLGVGRAGEIAATAMNQFGLSGSQVSHVADLLAAGAGKAQGSVEDLALGLTYVGPVAAGMGISIEQTTGVLAEFASAGLVGEKGGTALRGVLLSLTAPSDSASQKMQELGIHLYDAQGKFIGVDGAAQQLHDRLSPLDEATRNAALGQIFGNAQLAGAQVLYQGGAKAVQDWTGKVNDSGFAARQAAALTDNLKGDLERLGGAFDTVLIQSGSAANGGLRGLVQTVEHGVQAFGNLSPAIQTTVLAVSGVGGGALIAVGGFVLLAVKVAETAKAFKELEIASRLVSLTPIGLALTAAGVAAGFFVKGQMDAAAASAELGATLDKTTGAITEQTSAMVAARIQQALSKEVTDQATGQTTTLASAYSGLGLSLGTMTQAALGNTDAVAQMDSLQRTNQMTIDTLAAKHGNLTQAEYDQLVAAQAQGAQMTELRRILGVTTDGLGEQMAAQKAVGSAMQEGAASSDAAAGGAKKVAEGAATAAQAQLDQAAAAKEVVQRNQDLITSLTTLANMTLGARGAEREFQAAIDAADESLKKNGKTLDDNTEKGRANNAALDGLSKTTLDNVVATFKARDANQSLGDAVKVAEGQVSAGREAFVNAATSMGLNRDAAARLADQLGLTTANVDRLSKTVDAVPDVKTTKVTADTAQAQADVAKTSAAIRDTPDHLAQVRVDNAQARAAVIEASTAIRGTPDHQSQIRADNAVARAVVAANNQMIRAIPDHQSQIRADNAVARSVVSATNGMINAIPDHQSQIRADNAVALAAVRTASGAINAIPNHTSSIFATLPVLGAVAIANAAILGVPNKTAQVNADPSGARAGATAAQGAINSVTGKTVTITTNHVDNYSGNYANKPSPAATGGPVVGPGTGTSDTAGLWALSNGEHILTAAEVDAAGGHGAVMRLRKALLSGAVQYAATGGPAERSYSSSVTYHQVDQTNRATVQRTAPLINIEKILAADVDAGLRAANTRLQDYVAAYGIGG